MNYIQRFFGVAYVVVAASFLSAMDHERQDELLKSTLQTHGAQIESLVISPDNKYLASGDDQGGVKMWDLSSLEASSHTPTVCKGHTWKIHALAFSQDSQQLASGSGDETVQLWKVDKNNKEQEPQTTFLCRRSVHALAFSPNGKFLATANKEYGTSVVVWPIDVRGRVEHAAFIVSGYRGRGGTCGLVYLPDGKLVAHRADTVSIWHSVSAGDQKFFHDSVVTYDIGNRQGVITSLVAPSNIVQVMGCDGQRKRLIGSLIIDAPLIKVLVRDPSSNTVTLLQGSVSVDPTQQVISLDEVAKHYMVKDDVEHAVLSRSGESLAMSLNGRVSPRSNHVFLLESVRSFKNREYGCGDTVTSITLSDRLVAVAEANGALAVWRKSTQVPVDELND